MFAALCMRDDDDQVIVDMGEAAEGEAAGWRVTRSCKDTRTRSSAITAFGRHRTPRATKSRRGRPTA
jgi:hypothetical protein